MARCQDLLEFKSGTLQFLHLTVRDYLETEYMTKLLDDRAGKTFNEHCYMCNALVIRMRRPGRHVDWNGNFWYHCRLLKAKGLLDYCLFPLLERIAWQTTPDVEYCVHAEFLENHSNFPGVAARRDILGWLPHFIKTGVQITCEGGDVIVRPPLDVALRTMTCERRLEVVQRLLNSGADPNEKCAAKDHKIARSGKDVSAWEAYLRELEGNRNEFPWKHHPQVIEMLLHHGADPNVGSPNQRFFYNQLRSVRIPAEICDYLERLRLNFASRQLGDQRVGDHHLSRSPQSANFPPLQKGSRKDQGGYNQDYRWAGPYHRSQTARNPRPLGDSRVLDEIARHHDRVNWT